VLSRPATRSRPLSAQRPGSTLTGGLGGRGQVTVRRVHGLRARRTRARARWHHGARGWRGLAAGAEHQEASCGRDQRGERCGVDQGDIAALAVHLMTTTAITGATFDIDGGRQPIPASSG